MKYEHYRFDGTRRYTADLVKTDDKQAIDERDDGERILAKNRQEISDLQETLYAEGKQSLLVILQAMDAAGKDGTIKHVFSGVNPQGVTVSSFKQPNDLELSHDYLWRVHRAMPARGMIGVFNRSHYEDVLVGRVLDLPQQQALPTYALEDIWTRRYRQIREFEQMAYENGTIILKFYLHLSRKEQTERFVDRMKDPSKNWKFSKVDLLTSDQWDVYMYAYTQAINETALPHAPWFVIPADRKWYARAVISEVILDTLKRMALQFPEPSEEQKRDMEAYRETLR